MGIPRTILISTLTIPLLSQASITFRNQFQGISQGLLQNATARLELKQKRLGKNPSANTLKNFYKQAPREIQQALEPFGYFRSKVTARLQKTKDHWIATYHVNKGPRLKITKLSIKIIGEASKDSNVLKLIKEIPLHKGDYFNANKYNNAKDQLLDFANRHGYLQATLPTSKIYISPAKYTCEINLILNSGPKFFFGPAKFNKTLFDQEFLYKFLNYKPGQSYSTEKLLQVQENFENSNLFQAIVIEPEIQKAKNLHVPVLYQILPRKSQQYNFGIGYGTDTGPRGLISTELRNLTRTGHHLSSAIQASLKQAELESHYIIPGNHPGTDKYDLGLTVEQEDDNIGINRTIQFVPSYVTSFHGWQRVLQLSIQHNWFRLEDDKTKRSATLIVPKISFNKSKSNNPIHPTKGYRISFELLGAVKGAVSDVSFAQSILEIKTISPLTYNTSLVLKTALAYTITDDDKKIPPDYLFSAGGIQSIRGYDYQDKRIGFGDKLTIVSAELRQRIYGDWFGEIFYDAGDASNKLFEHIYQGAGIGLVWFSPVGSIQATFARPVDQPGKWKLQIGMGIEL